MSELLDFERAALEEMRRYADDVEVLRKQILAFRRCGREAVVAACHCIRASGQRFLAIESQAATLVTSSEALRLAARFGQALVDMIPPSGSDPLRVTSVARELIAGQAVRRLRQQAESALLDAAKGLSNSLRLAEEKEAGKPTGSGDFKPLSWFLKKYPDDFPTDYRLNEFIRKHKIRTHKPSARRLNVSTSDFQQALENEEFVLKGVEIRKKGIRNNKRR